MRIPKAGRFFIAMLPALALAGCGVFVNGGTWDLEIQAGVEGEVGPADVTVVFPDRQSLENCATLKLQALEPQGFTCRELLEGAVAPEDARELGKLQSGLPLSPGTWLRGIPERQALFFAEAGDASGTVLLRGCTSSPARKGLDITIGMACVCQPVPGTCAAWPEIPANGIDDDCDSMTDECTISDECDDGNDCTQDICQQGECQNTNYPDGLRCEDGLWCTEEDACSGGWCSGKPRDCSDAEQCTTDACDEENDECTHVLQQNPGAEGPMGDPTCGNEIDDDCDGLTDGEDPNCRSCSAASDCDDGNPCTKDLCGDSQCSNQSLGDGTTCGDGLWCTVMDSCSGGVCGGSRKNCDDGDACTVDSCNEAAKSCDHQWEEQPGAEGTGVAGTCSNGVDDDCDQSTDGDDPDCVSCSPTGDEGPAGDLTCSNGKDDDCDGLTDGEDDGCLPQGQCGVADVDFALTEFSAGGFLDILAADFDEDGLDDLVVTSTGGYLYVFQNRAGNIQSAQSFYLGSTSFPQATVAGDFDSDGILDLAVVSPDDNTVYLLTGEGTGGTGDGSFSARGDLTFSTGNTAYANAATADFDADGKLDLLLISPEGSIVSVYQGQGDGAFVNSGDFSSGGISPVDALVADLNADGILDLVVANSGTTEPEQNLIAVLPGTGNNGRWDGFGNPTVHSITGRPFFIASADFNSDGILDIAVASSNHNLGEELAVFPGTGSNGVGDGDFAPPSYYHRYCTPWALVTADFNGDFVADLALACNNTSLSPPGRIDIMLGDCDGGRGTGTFTPKASYSNIANNEEITGMVSADFDANGFSDLAYLDMTGRCVVMKGLEPTGRKNAGTERSATIISGGKTNAAVAPGTANESSGAAGKSLESGAGSHAE